MHALIVSPRRGEPSQRDAAVVCGKGRALKAFFRSTVRGNPARFALAPPGQSDKPETRRYRAMYMIVDVEVGVFSDTAIAIPHP